MSYDLYDNRGNKIGEIRNTAAEEAGYVFLALIIAAFVIGLVVVPYWASYNIGKGTWNHRRILTKIVSGFFLFYWTAMLALVAIGGIVGSIVEGNFLQNLLVGMLGILGVGSVALAYRIGKAQRESERTTSKTSTANRWLGR